MLRDYLTPQAYQSLQRAKVEALKRNVKPDPKTYVYPRLYGGAAIFWDYKGREVILSGPYETGKTFAALTKFHKLMRDFPGAQGLWVRATYTSLIGSACVTYENKVLDVHPDMPGAEVTKYGGERPSFYIYNNGSRIWLGGLDHPDKFLSAEFDFIYVNQAEEIALDAWETLTGRATGRAGNSTYSQIMGDCNPSFPHHWILDRRSKGKLELFEQLHEHNPMLFDQATGEVTEQGKATFATLDAMTGVRYQRGRRGLWVAAEGVIFDNFSPTLNVSNDAEYNPNAEVYWGVDDGYAYGEGPGTASYHPRVVLLGQQSPQGGMNVFCEYVKTGVASYQETIAEVLALPYKRPTAAYIDSSAAMFTGALWEADIYTIPSTHPVAEGIKNLRRLICDGKDVRLFKIHSRCANLIRELQSYRYDDKSAAASIGEPKPLKLDDHCIDATRYLVWPLHWPE